MSTVERIFEVKIKKNGKVFSRHYPGSCQEQASRRARKLGKILSVKKLHKEDLIGIVTGINLNKAKYENKGVIFEETTIEDILFNKSGKINEKEKRRRRFQIELNKKD